MQSVTPQLHKEDDAVVRRSDCYTKRETQIKLNLVFWGTAATSTSCVDLRIQYEGFFVLPTIAVIHSATRCCVNNRD